jgi:predicted DCC family thiol-disulfide oxidoreductase YuxK
LADFTDLTGRLLVLYDGECGFCNYSIRWLLSRDGHDRLRFAPSNLPAVQELLSSHGVPLKRQNSGPNLEPESGPDTLLVFRNTGTPVEELLVRSNAFLACLRVLPQPWPSLAAILRLLPRALRDFVYRLIARHRYRIWGRFASCPIPTPEERLHFL